MKRKISLWLVSSIIILSLLFGCDKPELTGIEIEDIDTFQDPLQASYQSEEPMILRMKDDIFTITPLAKYKLFGVVVSKKSYSDDWNSKISPIDLAIVWGRLAEPEYERYITYRQSNRWYFYKYKQESPFDDFYVITHSANNHIIPANENIDRAIKTIKEKDKVVLEGFLVNVKGTYNGRPVFWNTSLSRTDTGKGSCELFYVSKIRRDTRVYE